MAGARGAPGSARVTVFVIVAGILTVGLVTYTLTHRRPPIPADADHAGAADPARCLACHGPGQREARSPNHPLNDQCFGCHDRS